MKKINLFLVLFFAWFVGLSSVFAEWEIDGQLRTYYGEWAPKIHSYAHSVGVSSTTQHDYYTYDYFDSWNYRCDYNLFGTYPNGNLICYDEPQYSQYPSMMYFSYNTQVGADSQGNATWSQTFEATDYVDFDFGANAGVRTWTRFDFSVHINFNTVPDFVRKAVLGSLQVDPIMPSGASGQSYCTSNYSEYDERINISCSFKYDGSNLMVRLRNLNDYNFAFQDTNYYYYMYFDVSNVMQMFSVSPPSDVNLDDFDTDYSPGGTTFDDDYNTIDTTKTWFNSIDFSQLNGLTSLVTSPVRLINSLNAETRDDLEFTIFKSDITIPNGCSLFWCKTNRDFTNKYIGGKYYTRSQQYSTFNAFRTFWRNVFGGLLIFYSLHKAFKVAFRLMSPTNETDVEGL